MNESRPPSLLQPHSIGASSLVVGLLTVVGAHGVLPAGFFGAMWLLTALGLAIPPDMRERPISEEKVIAAEFVQLGKKFDPRKLPNRKVPPVVKRRPDAVAVSKNMNPEKRERRERKERPPKAVDDLLNNLVDRTKDFAEDVEVEQEGDPEGIQGGTATEARAGNIYLGKLVVFFRKGWELPVTLQDPDQMVATAAITIGDDGRLRAVRINKSSGNPDFDHSVVVRVENLIRANAKIPEPPPGLEGDFYGQTRAFQFHGKHAR